MEESFSSMESLIAKQLVQVGQIPKREASMLSKKAKPELIQQQKEIEREAEMESLETTYKPNTLAEPDFVRMEKNIAGFGFFTPSSKRIKNVPKVIKFTQTVDGSRVEARVIPATSNTECRLRQTRTSIWHFRKLSNAGNANTAKSSIRLLLLLPNCWHCLARQKMGTAIVRSKSG